MPTTKDFKGPKKAKASTTTNVRNPIIDEAVEIDIEIDVAAGRPKRRPGRQVEEDIQVTQQVTESAENTENVHMAHRARSGSDEDLARLEREAEEANDTPKIEIHFTGSELLRSRFPTPFALAEAVATDWVYGGEFDKLPINQPLAKFAAQQGLMKAKEVEKRVLESPAVEKAAFQILTVGMKAQGFVSQLREKLRR